MLLKVYILLLLLVNCNLIEINIRKIHYKVLSHKSLELLALNHIKLRMLLEAAHELVNSVFIIGPVLLKALDLYLSLRELLIELPQLLLLLLLLLFVNALLENLVLSDLG